MVWPLCILGTIKIIEVWRQEKKERLMHHESFCRKRVETCLVEDVPTTFPCVSCDELTTKVIFSNGELTLK